MDVETSKETPTISRAELVVISNADTAFMNTQKLLVFVKVYDPPVMLRRLPPARTPDISMKDTVGVVPAKEELPLTMVISRGMVYSAAAVGQVMLRVPANMSPSAWNTADSLPPASISIAVTLSDVPPLGTESPMVAVYPAVMVLGRSAPFAPANFNRIADDTRTYKSPKKPNRRIEEGRGRLN